MKPALLFALFLAAALSCSGDNTAVATDNEVLLEEGGCRGCRIVADTIALLGDDRDTLSIDEGATPVRDSRGRFYIIEKGGGSVLVYGPDGQYMQSFGKRGEGPGEFWHLSELHVLAGDTILAVGGGQIHVLSPEYQHVRQTRSQGMQESGYFNTLLEDGRVVRLAGPHKFLLIDRSGTPGQPILLEGSDTAKCMECGFRTFREGHESGTIWSAPQNAYRVELHDLSGKLLRRYVREVTWFPPWSERNPDRAVDVMAELNKVRTSGVRQSEDGLVWVHVLSMEPPKALPRFDDINDDAQAVRIASEMSQLINTTLEAFDPKTGRVQATKELNGVLIPMTGDYAAQMLLNEYGDWMCRVLRFRVEGRESTQEKTGGD